MQTHDQRPVARRRHLLTDEQLAVHASATSADLASVHRHGNGIRVHRTYILVVSLAALVLLGFAIVMASATM